MSMLNLKPHLEKTKKYILLKRQNFLTLNCLVKRKLSNKTGNTSGFPLIGSQGCSFKQKETEYHKIPKINPGPFSDMNFFHKSLGFYLYGIL